MRDHFLEGKLEEGFLEAKEEKTALKEPKRYKVILLNDDYTPMEFVVHVLMKFLYMNKEKAISLMLDVHNKGRAVCGVFTREIAETKMQQINQYATFNEHPLLCQIEIE